MARTVSYSEITIKALDGSDVVIKGKSSILQKYDVSIVTSEYNYCTTFLFSCKICAATDKRYKEEGGYGSKYNWKKEIRYNVRQLNPVMELTQLCNTEWLTQHYYEDHKTRRNGIGKGSVAAKVPFCHRLTEEKTELEEKERNSCVVHSFANAFGMPYAEAHALLKKHGREDGEGTRGYVSYKAIKELKESGKYIVTEHHLDYVKSEYRYVYPTLNKVLATLKPNGSYMISVRDHMFAYVNGKIVDSYRVGGKSQVHKYIEVEKVS